VTITSKNGVPTPSVTVTPSAQNVTTVQDVLLTVTVNGGIGNPSPTGSVIVSSGSYASAPSSLTSGTATIDVPAGSLPSGGDNLTAVYTPDSGGSSSYSSASGSAFVLVTTPGAATPTVTVTPSLSTAMTASYLMVTITVGGGAGQPTPTGSVVLTSGAYTSAPATLTPYSMNTTAISIPAGSLWVGTDTLTATYTPDSASASEYNQASGTATITVTPGMPSTTVTVTPSASTVNIAQSLTVTITVGPIGYPTPAGSVVLTSSQYTSPQTTLKDGSATITIPAFNLAAGTDSLDVSYTPDASSSLYYSSGSGSASVTVTLTPTVVLPCQNSPAAGGLSGQAWWSNGPCGGWILALVVDPTTPTTLYVGSDGAGIFKSTDGGGTWRAINNGLLAGADAPIAGQIFPVLSISALSIDPTTPTTLYALTGAGLFKTTDAGATWSALAEPAWGNVSACPNVIAVDPKTSGTLYIAGGVGGGGAWGGACEGVTGGGIYKSTDGGGTWSFNQLDQSEENAVFSIAIDPLTPTTLYASAGGNSGTSIYKSTDGGQTWNPAGAGLPASADYSKVWIDPVTPTTLYTVPIPVGGGALGVYKSTDGGGSWTAINNGLPYAIWSVALDPAAPTTLYAGEVFLGRVYKSTDGGANWKEVAIPNGTYLPLFAFGVNPGRQSTLYAAGYGAFRSTDGGVSWSETDTGLSATNISALAVDPTTPSTIYAGTSDTSGGGMFKSTDGGASWTPASNGLPNNVAQIFFGATSLAIDPSTPTTLYAAGNGVYGGYAGVYKSTDGAGSWTAVNSGLSDRFVNALAIDPATPNTIYAGTDSGVFQSTNGAAGWTAVNSGMTVSGTTPSVYALAIDPVTPATIYALSVPSSGQVAVFKSTNRGASWTTTGSISGYLHVVNLLAIDPKAPSTIYYLTFDGLTKSTDGGLTWNTTDIRYLDEGYSLVIDPITPSTMYLGTYGFGVLKSTDGGQSWNPLNAGLAMTTVNALAIDSKGTNLLAGTSAGVFSYALRTPAPTMGGLSPNSATAGDPAFTLTVNGTNLSPGAAVYWGTTALATTFVSEAEVTAWVPAPLVSTAGTPSITVVTSGGTSAPATFTIVKSACDVNQYGSTKVTDVQAVVNEALGLGPGVNDLNQDGLVNIVDVQLVINSALSLGCAAL
jgi:photosystem II stability/assembly factor-like uncharacterized protein